MMKQTIQKEMEHFLAEDGFSHNFFYYHSLPLKNVHCCLKFKDHLTIAGLPYFAGVFQYLSGPSPFELNLDGEGKTIRKEDQFELSFHLPFALALTGERTALNLLQKACAVATYTTQCVEKARPLGIEILDTRKTTPGLRQLEKYAVRVGGGKNHRMHQTDVWMIKDNHKSFFGGLKKALDFFHSLGAFYHSLVVEVHDLSELVEAMELGGPLYYVGSFFPGPD